jgi:hypothetical protein
MCRNLALSTGKSLNILSSFKASLIMVVEVSRLTDFAVMMKFQSSSFPARSEACEEREEGKPYLEGVEGVYFSKDDGDSGLEGVVDAVGCVY